MNTAANPIQEVFKRTEKKYLLTRRQMEMLQAALADRMEPDVYEKYSIYNIYFDTPDFSLIRTSIEKPVYKEKIRLRSYCIPYADDSVFLELKKKSKGVVGKRRVTLTLKEAETYLFRRIYPERADCQILHEIDFALGRYQVLPAAYIAYDREALSGLADPQLRITFDENITCRKTDLQLEKGRYGLSLLEENQVLMEVKIPGAMPVWLANLLSELRIFPISYSKYGTYYKQYILPEQYMLYQESLQRLMYVKGGVCYA